MTDWQTCSSCGDVHPVGRPSATLLLEYTKQNQHDGKLSPDDAEALRLLAKCVHAQLYAAVADIHNLRVDLQEARASKGAVTDSGTHYAVCKRNGDIIESPALDLAVMRFDNMQSQAADLGFESSGAAVIHRQWATYTTDWATVPDEAIEQARARALDQFSDPGPEPEF